MQHRLVIKDTVTKTKAVYSKLVGTKTTGMASKKFNLDFVTDKKREV